jgi:hypothetical protein
MPLNHWLLIDKFALLLPVLVPARLLSYSRFRKNRTTPTELQTMAAAWEEGCNTNLIAAHHAVTSSERLERSMGLNGVNDLNGLNASAALSGTPIARLCWTKTLHLLIGRR